MQVTPTHAKVLQQLGWLYHQDGSSFQNRDALPLELLVLAAKSLFSLLSFMLVLTRLRRALITHGERLGA